jgi:hypothetical protein
MTARWRASMASFAIAGLVVFALSIACAASAAESVSLQSEFASGTLDQLKCWGGVTVRLGDWVVTGDEAVCDLASRTIRVTGNVEIQTPDGAFTGEEAAFTEADETFTLDKGGFEATVGSSGSPVYFVAERITFVRSSAQLDGTTVTTCDRLDPHWYIRAKTIEWLPSDRVVLHGATLWEFGLPLFYWPRLTLPVKDGMLPKLPDIGYTASTGFYVRLDREYGHEDSGGKLSFDVYQRTGFGTGIEHHERLSDKTKAEGSAYLLRYWGGHRFFARVSAGVSSALTDELAIAASASYRPEIAAGSIEKDELEGKASLNYSRPGTRASLGLAFNGTSVPQLFASRALDASASHQFSQTLGVEVKLALLDKSGRMTNLTEVSDSLTNYMGRMTYQAGRAALSLTFEDSTEFSASLYGITRKERLARTPELSLNLRQVSLPWLTVPMSAELSLGDYGYSSTGSSDPSKLVRDSRALVGASVPLTRFASLGNAAFSYSIDAGYRYYGSGAEMAFVAPQVRAELSSGAFTGSLTRSITAVYGYTPLIFDGKTPQDQLTARASYRLRHLTASVQSSVDLLSNKLDPVAVWLRYSPEEKLALDLSYSYDVENQRPYSAIVRFSDRRYEDRLLRLGVHYNLVASAVSRAEAEVGYRLTDRLKLVGAISYDGVKNEWNRGDVALVADLHCREISLRYDIGRGQIWAQYRLFALPDEHIKVGLDEEEGLLLDSSIFQLQ